MNTLFEKGNSVVEISPQKTKNPIVLEKTKHVHYDYFMVDTTLPWFAKEKTDILWLDKIDDVARIFDIVENLCVTVKERIILSNFLIPTETVPNIGIQKKMDTFATKFTKTHPEFRLVQQQLSSKETNENYIVLERIPYKFAILVIATINTDREKMLLHFWQNVVKKYAAYKPLIDTYFLFDDLEDTGNKEGKVTGDCFMVHSPHPRDTLTKTLQSFRYFYKNAEYNYDFVVRTNLSSYIRYPLLCKQLLGYIEHNSVNPTVDMAYFGFNGYYSPMLYHGERIIFKSGSCYVVSRGFIKNLLIDYLPTMSDVESKARELYTMNSKPFDYEMYALDDVFLAALVCFYGYDKVNNTSFKSYPITSLHFLDYMEEDCFHFRLKHSAYEILSYKHLLENPDI